MNCKVCGSAEFVTNDGITYCTECQSQIEETQTEVAVEHTLSRDIGSSKPKKTSTQKKAEYTDWITVEGFNYVLYMQVSSLIKLGASPKLKPTVLNIWTKYLQKCESAFRIDYLAKDEPKPLLGTSVFKRDLKVLYGTNQTSKRKRKKPEESDAEPSDNLSADEDLLIEDNDAISDTNADLSVNSEDKNIKPKFSSHARKVLRKKRPKYSTSTHLEVYNMTLAKTLSICYLGLLYTEDLLSLADLIRLVYEEKVPFLNLRGKFPPSLKLQCCDIYTFNTTTVPDAYTIQKTSREIMHFIKLPEYKEPSVSFAAARIVKDLNLPGDILPIVTKLTERFKEKKSLYYKAKTRKIQDLPPEYQALAAILVAMKMLFVLDDKFEIEHSEVMTKLNALHPDRNYFVWKDWKEHSIIKEFLFLREKTSYFKVNNLDSLSANLIISKYPFTRLKPTSSEDLQNYSALIPCAKHRICKVLSDLVHIPNSNPNVPTSFPLRRNAKCFMEEWKTLQMFRKTKEMDLTLLRKDFSSCSLNFNPLQFNEIDDELSHLLMTSLYIPETSINLGRKYGALITYHHKFMRTTSSYWFFYFSDSDFVQWDITLTSFDKLPNSFKWLINFFSKYAYCKNIALYKEVYLMEKILFLEKRNIYPTFLNNIKNKVNLDF